jgi:hypothetical protein
MLLKQILVAEITLRTKEGLYTPIAALGGAMWVTRNDQYLYPCHDRFP